MRRVYLLAVIIIIEMLSANVYSQNAYITRNDTVSVINTTTNRVIAHIPTGVSPDAVVVSPDGLKAFITHYGNPNYLLSVINTTTNTVSGNIPITANTFGADGIDISPDGSKLYVPNLANGGTSKDSVWVINALNNSVIAKIALTSYGSVEGIAVNPAGTKVYVAHENKIAIIDALTNALSNTVTVGSASSYFYGIAVTPDGSKVYATDYLKNTVYVLNTSNNAVTPIATGIGSQPWGVVAGNDGTKVYVTDYKKSVVYVISTATNTVINTINVGLRPYGIALTPDGSRLYTAQAGSKFVYVVSTATNSVIDSINVRGNSFAFGKFIGPKPAVACANGSTNITSNLNGANFQWQVSTDSINFTNLTDNANYTGTHTSTLQLNNISSGWYGYRYRSIVDGVSDQPFTLTFHNKWLGTNGAAWENAANWGCKTIPDVNSDVIINTGTLILNSNTTVRSLTINPWATLNVTPGFTLTVTK